MTNTLTPRDEKKAAKSKSLAKHETGVGLQKHKRGAIDILIAVLTPIAGSELLDKYNLRGAFNKGIFESTGPGEERSIHVSAVDQEPEVSLWDLAPLDILVREAGGRFTNLAGEPGPHGGSAVATNGLLHEEVLKALS
ncbi:Probable acyl-CoA dehydrogenase [Mycobacteroides abscessus subsp. abscessus]|nr:Probable acyl-CoA dehydrogenase [Mycobacteroides abscessus subsp. abscessus]